MYGVWVTVSVHGKSVTVENINVEKYSISGEITIKPESESYHAKDTVDITARLKQIICQWMVKR